MYSELIGIGLYSIPEAARLTGIKSANIARWMFGNNTTKPLWHPQVEDPSLKTIGFRDLIELRFINEFYKRGVNIREIRKAIEGAKHIYGSDSPYPFTLGGYKTDGQTVLRNFVDSTEYAPVIIELSTLQQVINDVVQPSLDDVILENELATRWYPLKNSKAVVLNPDFSFGKPIVEQYGVPTSVLYDSYLVEGDVAFVAQIFEVTENAVQDSTKYEESLLHIAA